MNLMILYQLTNQLVTVIFFHSSQGLTFLDKMRQQRKKWAYITSISFFIPPINTVFYLIEQLIQYFVLLNDCDKEQKKESGYFFHEPDDQFSV